MSPGSWGFQAQGTGNIVPFLLFRRFCPETTLVAAWGLRWYDSLGLCSRKQQTMARRNSG